MNPDKDISIVVAGEGAQTAALLRTKQVDALSQFDTQYALIENAGVKLRLLDTPEIEKFPVQRLRRARGDAHEQAQGGDRAGTRLCQGHGVRDRQSGGRDPHLVGGLSADQGDRQGRGDRAEGRREDARGAHRRLAARGRPACKKWGENSEANYEAYVDFLVK